MTRPRCAGSPLDWHSPDPLEQEACKAVCRGCGLRESCLAGAVERDEPCGVWGAVVFGVVELAEPVAWSLPEIAEPVHNRGHYVQGCRAPECLAANAAWMREWRTRRAWSSPVEHAPMPEQLDLFGPVTTNERVLT